MASNHHPPTNHETTPLLPTAHPSEAHPSLNHDTHAHHEGESHRSGFHPLPFLRILYNSSCTASKYVNVLWPFVPVAIALQFVPGMDTWKFLTAYTAVIPCANLLGFAGQEFARKMPKVLGILVEVGFGGLVEGVLFLVLIAKSTTPGKGEVGIEGNAEEQGGDLIPIIQAAILGSILTNLLLCLGLCFFAGGLRQTSQKFHAIVSEVGTGLLLVAAFGLLIPSAFYSALKSEAVSGVEGFGVSFGGVRGHGREELTRGGLKADVLHVSRATAIALIVAFGLYIWFQARSQHSIFDEVIEMDEHRDADRLADGERPKFTMTETVVALGVSLALVTLLLVLLVDKIEHVVELGVPDQFLGLILLPLVEKAAEHLTAIDEAWDGVINVALYHCLAPSIQTALLNGPLVVLVGWVLGKPMDLNFEIFMIGLLVLSILVVGNFLRDGESNWLEGALLVIVYVIIAIACWYYPNPDVATSNSIRGSVVNVPMTIETLEQLQKLLVQYHSGNLGA